MIKFLLLFLAVVCAGILGAFVTVMHWQLIPLLILCFFAGEGAASLGEKLS